MPLKRTNFHWQIVTNLLIQVLQKSELILATSKIMISTRTSKCWKDACPSSAINIFCHPTKSFFTLTSYSGKKSKSCGSNSTTAVPDVTPVSTISTVLAATPASEPTPVPALLSNAVTTPSTLTSNSCACGKPKEGGFNFCRTCSTKVSASLQRHSSLAN